jgi:homoserine dehydrogenase
VRPEDVYREGITKLGERDFAYARELGYAIKLIAMGRRRTDGLELRVHPSLVSSDALLARVDGVLNAVEIEGDLMDRVLFEGPGAGTLPTTSAVVADALDAAVSISSRVYWPYASRREEGLRALPIGDVRARYYLRIGVADQPGVLARIATILGDGAISIASVIQKEVDGEGTAEIVIMTHEAREADMRGAIARIEALDAVGGVQQLLRVMP